MTKGEAILVIVSLFILCCLFVCLVIACIAGLRKYGYLIIEYTWGWIPDRCQEPKCRRKGIYGNENRMEDGSIICDDCSVRWYLREQGLVDCDYQDEDEELANYMEKIVNGKAQNP